RGVSGFGGDGDRVVGAVIPDQLTQASRLYGAGSRELRCLPGGAAHVSGQAPHPGGERSDGAGPLDPPGIPVIAAPPTPVHLRTGRDDLLTPLERYTLFCSDERCCRSTSSNDGSSAIRR